MLFREENLPQEIKSIVTNLPFRMGNVNCYLVSTGQGFVLIDTGSLSGEAVLDKDLERAGCQPGELNLILLTHGDFDHIGNAAHLREKFHTRIAMHKADSVMAENGDMFGSRQKANNILTKKLVPFFFGFNKKHRFSPDLFVDEGDNLVDFGLEAKVLHLPGHSKGSIGVLMASGDLFCGDLLESSKRPSLNSLIDDLEDAKNSLEKLKSLDIKMVYPGHGKPFEMASFLKSVS